MKIDAEARRRLEALRGELRAEARASVPAAYKDRGMVDKYLKGDNAASGMDESADRIDDILREADTATTPSQTEQAKAVPDVDELAQFIRRINGANEMGAGLLAEAIVGWLDLAKQEADHEN